MTATATPLSVLATPRRRWQSNFLAVLPAVEAHAQTSFRRLRPEARAEAIAESVARAFVDYGSLARRRCLAHAYPGSLATFAVKAVRSHRRVGGHRTTRDVSSPVAQAKHGLFSMSLTPWDASEGTWREVIVESKHVCPADRAAFRLGFGAGQRGTGKSLTRCRLASGPPMWRNASACLSRGSASSGGGIGSHGKCSKARNPQARLRSQRPLQPHATLNW